MSDKIIFYYDPQSRASVTRWALEEAGADYEIHRIDLRNGDTRSPDFLKINPMGKIPTLVLPDGTVVTENGAIIAWLAEAYPDANLAPSPGSPQKATMLRWLSFTGSCFEPALTQTMAMKDVTLDKRMTGWGSYDEVIDNYEKALAPGPWLLGERFSAADIYVGASLAWAGQFGAPRIGDSAVIQAYVARCIARDAYRRANAGA